MQCCTCTLTWYKAQLGVIAHSNYMDPYGMPNFLLFFMFEKHEKFWQSFAGPLSETHLINTLICHWVEKNPRMLGRTGCNVRHSGYEHSPYKWFGKGVF